VPRWDFQRGAAFFIYSVWYNAYPWNRWLEFSTNPANTVLTTPVRRAVFTTALFNPLFYLPSFYLMFGLLNFQSMDTIKTKMMTEYPEATKQCVMVYAPIYALQFTVIPPALQVAYSSVANFCWCVILSSLASADAILDEETQKFERFDSSAITVQGLVETAKELPSSIENMTLDTAPIDKVFQQLKATGADGSGAGGGHKNKAVECEVSEVKMVTGAEAAAAVAGALEEVTEVEDPAEQDFGRLVRLLQDERFRFFNKVELSKKD
jgi:hypothetical protein